MAPGPPETASSLRKRLTEALRAAGAGGPLVVPFGGPHYHHVVVRERGALCVRAWVCDPKKAEAYLREHGMFMPENAEEISEPGPDVVLEAADVDALIERVRAAGLLY